MAGAIALSYLATAYLIPSTLGFQRELYPIWPVTGVVLGILVVYGPQVWLGVAFGSFWLSLVLGVSPGEAIASTLSTTLAAVLGSYWLNQSQDQPMWGSFSNLLRFLWGCVIAVALSAILNTFFCLEFHTLDWATALERAGIAWVQEGLGVFFITPAMIAMFSTDWRWLLQSPTRRVPYSLLWLGLISSLVFGVFPLGRMNLLWTEAIANYPLEYLYFPVVVWMAFRYGAIGVVGSNLCLGLFAVMGFSQGQGIFIAKGANLAEATVCLQVFLGSMVIASLMLVAAIEELKLTTHHLQTTILSQSEQLQEKQAALSRSNQLRNCFLEAVTHDLRTTVMGTVMLYQNLLKKPGNEIAMSRRLLERMVEGSDRQLTKLNTLLEIATLDSGSLELEYQPINLALLLERVIEDLQPYFRANQVSLTYSPPEHCPTVEADPTQIRRVIEHLLSNAVKHNPPGINLKIKLKQDPTGFIYCSVTDNGVGIAPEQLPYLFSLDPLLSEGHCPRNLRGIGLGLYQSHQILAAHGGHLGVESTPLGGSCFWFVLPVPYPL